MFRHAIMIGLLAATASGNLIDNGGFETNTENTGVLAYFGDVADGWTPFTDVFAAATPDAWSTTGADGNTPGDEQVLYGASSYEGVRWTAIASDPVGASGLSEGIESSPFDLVAGVAYRLSLAMMFDDTNPYGRTDPAALTVRLRRGEAEESTIIGTFAETAMGLVWETRTLGFTADASDSYTLILSNEDIRPSYLSIDKVILQPGACPPDIDGTGDVGFDDLVTLLGAWGPCATACAADLDCNGLVGFDDLALLLGSWGPCPSL